MGFWGWILVALAVVGVYTLVVAMMKAASGADDIDEGDD